MRDEKNLITKAQKGDHHAFEELVEPLLNRIYNHACRMMNNAEDGADMAQEALVKAFLNIGKFRNDSSFSTWIFRITHNVCLDEIRKRKKVVILPVDEQPHTASRDPKPEEIYESKEAQSAVFKALNKLSDAHKTVILLRDVEGYSYEEIAQITNTSIGTVKSRISRGRTQLKSILSKSNMFGTKYGIESSNCMKEVE